jgi:catechol 2,3-dioxygenase-like lactoylglutathione lyase family enzyme
MNAGSSGDGNVTQVVPFFLVSSMERSLRYYVDGLGFTMTNKCVVDGKVRWWWLELGGVALAGLRERWMSFFNPGFRLRLHPIVRRRFAAFRLPGRAPQRLQSHVPPHPCRAPVAHRTIADARPGRYTQVDGNADRDR